MPGQRLSIKASNFAETHKAVLWPIYKYYQAIQFFIYGPRAIASQTVCAIVA
jgi:hypothetical protein